MRRPLLNLLTTSSLIVCAGAVAAWVWHDGKRPSSASVEQARRRGLLVAECAVPANTALGEYRPIQVWVERRRTGGNHLVVRLQGPHVGLEPRVDVTGLSYGGIWSERNGPPYELWAVPDPPPDALTLRRGDDKIDLRPQPG